MLGLGKTMMGGVGGLIRQAGPQLTGRSTSLRPLKGPGAGTIRPRRSDRLPAPPAAATPPPDKDTPVLARTRFAEPTGEAQAPVPADEAAPPSPGSPPAEAEEQGTPGFRV